ncbi:MAG: pectate lyase [Verrucomicrobiota bacterium]|jgi:PelA/Pel-15E family pectate lyase
MKQARSVFMLAICSGVAVGLTAAIVGTNPPALPLTTERIASLPLEQQAVWMAYLERSTRQSAADRAFLQTERKEHAVKKLIIPSATRNAEGIALDKPADWYGKAKARRIANIIVSFQTPAGGWSKNLDMTRSVRVPGESFTPDSGWNYVGTFDNDATTTQLRFLAKVITATGANNASDRAAFQRGLDYIFDAQYPNGGWPQVWPLQGGYHDAVTYNDDAMPHVLEFLRDVAGGQNEFAFVPVETRARATASLKRGIDCVLATQIVVNGRRTVWCQQHDPLRLQPASARNYEMPAQASSESAAIVLFLMQLPNPDSNVVAAVRAAAAWFEKTQIRDVAFRKVWGRGRLLVSAPGNGPLWARYYEIGTDRPIFGDHDRSVHDDVNEISRECQNGYGWYRDSPKRVLERYAQWSREHP